MSHTYSFSSLNTHETLHGFTVNLDHFEKYRLGPNPDGTILRPVHDGRRKVGFLRCLAYQFVNPAFVMAEANGINGGHDMLLQLIAGDDSHKCMQPDSSANRAENSCAAGLSPTPPVEPKIMKIAAAPGTARL
jgi:hypothetical protein